MDDIDISILNILSKQARLSVSEISKKINLSVPAVSERIRKLEKSGTIENYSVILNARKLKKELTAIMLVTIERTKSTGDFFNFIESSNDILECHYIAGDFDYILKIMTQNTQTLEALLNKIKGFRGVHKTRTIVVLSTYKNNPSVLP